HRDDRHRDGDVDLHQYTGGGGLRHGDPDHPANHTGRRPLAAGVDASGRRSGDRDDLADHLLHALQPLDLYKEPLPRRYDAGPRRPRDPGPDSLGREHDRPPQEGEVTMRSLQNIIWLGFKELRSLLGDKVMVLFVAYAFTLAIYSQATGTSNDVNNAS